MPSELTGVDARAGVPPVYQPASPYLPPPHPPEGGRGVPWGRYLAALWRYKWLMLAIVVTGGSVGFVLAKRLVREYEVQGTIWISSATPLVRESGPIRAEELLSTTSWPELLRSFVVLDKVVLRADLYKWALDSTQAPLIEDLEPSEKLVPGEYELRVDTTGRRYVLATREGAIVESGLVGDSIGRPAGLSWLPPEGALQPGTVVRFGIIPPRTASGTLRDRLLISLPQNSSLMRVTLAGNEPQQLALSLNTLLEEFVSTAAALKKANLIELAATLDEQMTYAGSELRAAEIALENFRVNTITLPSESGPVAGGIAETRAPALTNFFSQKIQYDNTRQDREALDSILVGLERGTLDVNALWSVPSIQTSGPDLRMALTDYSAQLAALRAARQIYTDEHPEVRKLAQVLEVTRTRTVPTLVRSFISQLSRTEVDLSARIAGASRELRDIPTRTIEEMRLRRNVEVRESLYRSLKNRYEEARLSEASSYPDVVALDTAIAPQHPTKSSRRALMLTMLVGSMGLALGLALVLDRLDRRFRYPDQVRDEMGLHIVGAVPALPRSRAGAPDHLEAAQAVEAFRSIRLGLLGSRREPGPFLLTVTSPGANDGKSLISSNLALSLAEAGFRTLLVDGDIRRGTLHATFGATRRPGLVDYLEGGPSLDDVLRPTVSERLALLPSGARRRRGPELLLSPALQHLMADLRARYDVIIVDSAPLGAGIDPFVLGTATGNMLLVLRAGQTDRKLAMAKLELLDRLPIRLLGAVLNHIETTGAYKYYSYLYGYTEDEDEVEPAGRALVPASVRG